MVVILILGASSTNATPSHLLVHPPAQPDHLSTHYGHDRTGPSSLYRRQFDRSVSATTPAGIEVQGLGYGGQQKTPPWKEKWELLQSHGHVQPKYKSLSVPQLSFSQRFDSVSHPQSTTKTKANQRHSDEPVIKHITRVNICDASPQLDLANSHGGGAIGTTDAEPVTREGEWI